MKKNVICLSVMIALIFSGLITPATGYAETTKDSISKSDRDLLKKAVAKYRKAALVQVDLKKISIKKLLNKESTNEGILYFSGGLIRFEDLGVDKLLVVFDGKHLWSQQGNNITKSKIDATNRQQLIVTELLSKESLFTHFTLSEAKTQGGVLSVIATPKKNDWNLTKLRMRIDSKSELVSGIDYWDDLDNETRLDFKVQKMDQKKKSSLFKFTPPKGAEVTNL